MHDGLGIEVGVDVGGVLGGGVFVFGDKDCFIDDNCLGFYLPPWIDY
jgi:hypothetical protein